MGLLNSATPSAPTPTPMGMTDPARAAPAGAPAEGDTGDETPNVTPEEQAQYEQFVNNGMEVLYGGNDGPVRPDILQRLKESSDPVENLANTSAWLVTMLETSAEQKGSQLDDSVIMHGGKAMLEELVEIAEAASIHDYTDKEMENAWYKGLDIYRETATEAGKMDPQAMTAEFEQINEADKQGRMGEVLPGIEKAVQAAPAEAPAPAEAQ